MLKLIKSLFGDRKGVSAIEYALVASLIAVAAIAGFTQLGTKQGDQWNNVNNEL